MKFLFVAILATLAISTFALSDQEAQTEFAKWMQKYQKSYTNEEFQTKFAVFKANAEFIIAENKKNNTYRVAMNEFGDLTSEEFVAIFNGFAGERVKLNHPLSPVVVNTVGLPAHVDWRTKGAVTGVKNQGQCGSCWAFSTTGSTEGQHFLSGQGSLVGLSEQNLVDCSGSYGNMGCDGGLMDDAFQYIIANHGIDTEASYPYTATDGTCHYSAANKGASLTAYHDVPSGSEADLTSDIASVGPISVAIDASHSSFQFYSGGVYYEPACSSTQLDHGVLAVGYGDTGATNGKYYIVKNSWGASWGMSGYIWMSRDRNNNCGIATAASYPTA